MSILKKLLSTLLIVTFTTTLLGCATTQERGMGVVVSAKQIQKRDLKPHNATKAGVVIGGTGGAIYGGTVGALVGLLVAAFSSNSAAVIIAGTVVGAGAGAIIVGSVGAVTGAGLGYAVDVMKPGMGTYQYVVKRDNAKKPITITQYSSQIPIDSRVRIYQERDTMFIEQDE